MCSLRFQPFPPSISLSSPHPRHSSHAPASSLTGLVTANSALDFDRNRTALCADPPYYIYTLPRQGTSPHSEKANLAEMNVIQRMMSTLISEANCPFAYQSMFQSLRRICRPNTSTPSPCCFHAFCLWAHAVVTFTRWCTHQKAPADPSGTKQRA